MTRTARRELGSPKGTVVHSGLVALPLLVAMGAAWAQDGRSYGLTPSASLDVTVTDNANLSSSNRETDAVTRANVGISGYSSHGRIRGAIDYTLSGVLHSSASSRNEIQHRLSANGSTELIADHLFVDMTASVGQQAISAFGVQSRDPALGGANRTQVSTFSVSPYLRGTLGAAVGYEARMSGSYSDAGSSAASNNGGTSASFRLNSISSGSRISWSGSLSRQQVDYSLGRSSYQDRLALVLGYAVNQDLQVSLTGGQERNNYVTTNSRSHTDVGLQLNWRPSERTSLSASYGRQFFGSSHSVQFSYRTPRTAWVVVDSRGVSNTPGLAGTTISAYELYSLALTSLQPDPALRDQLVRQQLQRDNLNPNDPVTLGFVPASAAVQRTQSVSAVWFGLLDTVSLRLSRSQSNRLDTTTGSNSDLGQSDVVRQSGLSADVSHRLSPISSLALSAAYQRTRGQLASQSSKLGTLTLAYTTRFGRHFDAAAGVRHSRFANSTSPYDENAVWANVRVSF